MDHELETKIEAARAAYEKAAEALAQVMRENNQRLAEATSAADAAWREWNKLEYQHLYRPVAPTIPEGVTVTMVVCR